MQWQETRDDVRKLLCTLFKSWNIYLCRSLFNPMPWLVCLNGLMHQMVYLQLLCALCRFQPSLGLYSELPAAGPWAGPGAVCSGGPRSCCQKWLCGAVHFTFYKLSHRCLLRFSLQVSLHSQMFFLICVILFFFVSSPHPGYRHIHLLKADGSSLSPATLFIHVKVTRRGVPVKTMAERIAAAKGKAWHTSEQDNQISRQWRTLEGGAPSVNRQRQNAAVVLQFRPQVVQFAQNHFPVLEERCLSEMDTCPLVTVIHNKKM